MEVKIDNDGKEKYQSFTAQWSAETIGGMGARNIDLTGWGAKESEARNNLLEQAKAARNELNSAIECMIAELITSSTAEPA